MVRVSPQTETILTVLRHDGASHGFAIMNRTGLKSGTVYPILARLQDAGWVSSELASTPETRGRPPRRIYQLTPQAPQPARAL